MIVYYHNPYDKTSRDKLTETHGLPVTIENYTSPKANRQTWVSFLPTVILFDDNGQELARAEQPSHITKSNVQWMHTEHEKWKIGGKKGKFPKPPWS